MNFKKLFNLIFIACIYINITASDTPNTPDQTINKFTNTFYNHYGKIILGITGGYIIYKSVSLYTTYKEIENRDIN